MVRACQKYDGQYDFLYLNDFKNYIMEAIGDPNTECQCCGIPISECETKCEIHKTMTYNDCPCPKQEITAENIHDMAKCVTRQTEIRYFIKIKNQKMAKAFWKRLDAFVNELLG